MHSFTKRAQAHKRTPEAGIPGVANYPPGMALHAALAAAATLLATAFALCTWERWLARHKKHELMWTISLVMFALGSLGLWAGATLGWSEWTFKVFYLFGAILNVPFLALGTVYLLGDEGRADRWAAAVALLAAFATGMVVSAPIVGVIEPDILPQGSAVFGAGPRIAAAAGSGIASVVIFGGALWSAWRLAATWFAARRARAAGPALGATSSGGGQPARVSPGRLALANLMIASGTLVLASGGTLNSVADAMDAFAITLVAGIALIFAGFLLTSTPATPPVVEPWYPATMAASADPDQGRGPADAAVDRAGEARVRNVEWADSSPGSSSPGSPSLN